MKRRPKFNEFVDSKDSNKPLVDLGDSGPDLSDPAKPMGGDEDIVDIMRQIHDLAKKALDMKDGGGEVDMPFGDEEESGDDEAGPAPKSPDNMFGMKR